MEINGERDQGVCVSVHMCMCVRTGVCLGVCVFKKCNIIIFYGAISINMFKNKENQDVSILSMLFSTIEGNTKELVKTS